MCIYNKAEKFDLEKFKYRKFNATKNQLKTLEKLIKDKASETDVHKFLESNREIFSFALYAFQTGHHGSVVLSKQNIKPHVKLNSDKGLIPDFLVGGDNSDGYNWWIVELKGVNERVFSNDGEHIYFSSTLNKGIFQLLEYIDYCNKHQAMIREVLKLPNFREPNGLIIVGTEDEFKNERARELKAAWNRLLPKRLEIRSYSWLLRQFMENDKHLHFK